MFFENREVYIVLFPVITIRGNEIRGNEIRGNEIRGNQIRGNEIRGNEIRGNEIYMMPERFLMIIIILDDYNFP